MTNCCAIFRNRLGRWECSLRTWGFAWGWLGVAWRAVATVFLATIIAKLTDHDPSMFEILLVTALSYVQISLAANMFFIVGIQKEKPYFMLPYIVVGGLDLFIGIFGLLGGIYVLYGFKLTLAMSAFIPIALLVIGINFFMWVQAINLFRNMEVEITRKKEDTARLASIRQSYVND